MQIGIALPNNLQVQDMEGPTRKQAQKLRALRTRYLAEARAADEAGQDQRAFDLDCQAWDIERDLLAYGFRL